MKIMASFVHYKLAPEVQIRLERFDVELLHSALMRNHEDQYHCEASVIVDRLRSWFLGNSVGEVLSVSLNLHQLSLLTHFLEGKEVPEDSPTGELRISLLAIQEKVRDFGWKYYSQCPGGEFHIPTPEDQECQQ
jgi:hypothetical protein